MGHRLKVAIPLVIATALTGLFVILLLSQERTGENEPGTLSTASPELAAPSSPAMTSPAMASFPADPEQRIPYGSPTDPDP